MLKIGTFVVQHWSPDLKLRSDKDVQLKEEKGEQGVTPNARELRYNTLSPHPFRLRGRRRKRIALATGETPFYTKRPQRTVLRLGIIRYVERIQAYKKEERRPAIYDHRQVFSGPRRGLIRQVQEVLRRRLRRNGAPPGLDHEGRWRDSRPSQYSGCPRRLGCSPRE